MVPRFLFVIITISIVCFKNGESNQPQNTKTPTITNKSPATCPTPEDLSIFDLPDTHIGNLAAKYHSVIEHYCDYCPKCIREKRDLYMHHFDWSYPRPCFGYEDYCEQHQHYLPMPVCETDFKQTLTEDQKVALFFRQGDFGYIKSLKNEMKFICWPDPRGEYHSWLACSKHLQYCNGYMLRFDFRALAVREKPIRYDMDVLRNGQISEFI